MSSNGTIPAETSGPVDPTAVTKSGHRLGFLDALRGIAAVAVSLEHLATSAFANYAKFSSEWISFGTFGVVTFFLISGFIIPASMEKHRKLVHFWRGRFFRLYPMYLFVIAATLVCMHFGWVPGLTLKSWHLDAFVLANTTMMQEYMGFGDLLGVSWTLGLEMVFYILCSIAFLRGWLRSPVVLAMVAIGFLGVASTAGIILHRPIPMGRLGLLATCFFGTLVYRVYKGSAPAKALWLIVPLWLVFCEGFWLRFHLYPEINAAGVQDWHFKNVSITWAAAYVLFFSFYFLRRFNPPMVLQWLGKISYSFYLLADLIRYLIPRPASPWLWAVECTGATILVSAMTYRWIERPTMVLGAAPVAAPPRVDQAATSPV
jgi:peptidoglycan/LPS O-acetylase OafA/YrhL